MLKYLLCKKSTTNRCVSEKEIYFNPGDNDPHFRDSIQCEEESDLEANFQCGSTCFVHIPNISKAGAFLHDRECKHGESRGGKIHFSLIRYI